MHITCGFLGQSVLRSSENRRPTADDRCLYQDTGHQAPLWRLSPDCGLIVGDSLKNEVRRPSRDSRHMVPPNRLSYRLDCLRAFSANLRLLFLISKIPSKIINI